MTRIAAAVICYAALALVSVAAFCTGTRIGHWRNEKRIAQLLIDCSRLDGPLVRTWHDPSTCVVCQNRQVPRIHVVCPDHGELAVVMTWREAVSESELHGLIEHSA